MIDPEDRQLDEEQAMITYMAKLAEMERDGCELIPIAVGPFTAITVIGALQLATRAPDMGAELRRILRSVVDQLTPAFKGTLGEQIIRQGNHPGFDR